MELRKESTLPDYRSGEEGEDFEETRAAVIRDAVEDLLKEMENAINPDLRVKKAGEIKKFLDDLEVIAGRKATEDYYRRLNRIFDSPLPDIEAEKLPHDVIMEGKRRTGVFIKVEKMLERLETLKGFEAREELAKEIEEFLNKNEKIIARSDNSGAHDIKDFRSRLDNLRPKRESLAA